MPKVGLSRPYIAKYNDNGAGKVTYTDGRRAGRAVSYSLSAESSSSNDFYADNGLAESAGGTFTKGSLDLETAELEQGTSMIILGTHTEQIEVDGQPVTVHVYDDDMRAPYTGFGIIVKSIVRGVTKWRGVVLTKTQFDVPEDSATTQGESIEWQTSTISASVMRDDTSNHAWKKEATFDSEAKADAFVCHVLNIKDSDLETLTVTSTEGSTSGTTDIEVTPTLTDGRSYRYKVGKNLTMPTLHADLSDWAKWDGVADITAESGDTIIIAEVDAVGLAMASGSTTVTAKGDD